MTRHWLDRPLGARRAAPLAAVAVLALQLAAPASAAPVTETFEYTGESQTFTVPAGVTSLTFDVLGAQGGSHPDGPQGGLGAQAQSTLPVAPGDVLQINVGGQGGVNTSPLGCNNGNGGGGASDVRVGDFGLADRVVVAGGGGGAGGSTALQPPPSDCQSLAGGDGGAGGATAGGDGEGDGPGGEGGGPGTDSAGGAGGFGVIASGQPGQLFMGGNGGTFGSGVPGAGGFNGGAPGGVGSPGFGALWGGGGGGGGGLHGGGGGGVGGTLEPSVEGAGGGGGGGSSHGPAGTQFATGVQSGNGSVAVTYTPPEPERRCSIISIKLSLLGSPVHVCVF